MRRTLRVVAVIALLSATTGASSACGIGRACSAVGWSNTLTVELSGDAEAVVTVQACDDRGCSREAAPSDGVGFHAGVRTGDRWRFDLPDMSTPDEVTVSALDADGAVIREVTAELEWVRVGGSEQCGGPGEAALTL